MSGGICAQSQRHNKELSYADNAQAKIQMIRIANIDDDDNGCLYSLFAPLLHFVLAQIKKTPSVS